MLLDRPGVCCLKQDLNFSYRKSTVSMIIKNNNIIIVVSIEIRARDSARAFDSEAHLQIQIAADS